MRRSVSERWRTGFVSNAEGFRQTVFVPLSLLTCPTLLIRNLYPFPSCPTLVIGYLSLHCIGWLPADDVGDDGRKLIPVTNLQGYRLGCFWSSPDAQ